jgi:Trp operon repressor
MTGMRKKLERIKPAEKAATKAALSATIKRLDNNAEDFINNLLTERERITIGRRTLIANLILSGYTQMEINQRLSVSPNTYTKIKRWLDSALPNFESTNEIERGKINSQAKIATSRIDPLSLAAMEKKYPLHFLLFTLSKNVIDNLKD